MRYFITWGYNQFTPLQEDEHNRPVDLHEPGELLYVWSEKFASQENKKIIFNKSTTFFHGLHSLIIWLAPWVGKMNQILHCDWLPEQARWSYLACSGLLTVPEEKFPRKPYNKSFIDQAYSVEWIWTVLSWG